MRSLLSLFHPGCSTALLSLVFACTWGSHARSEGEPKIVTMERGYMFIDGKFLPPPYQVRVDVDSIEINGTSYGADYFGISEEELTDEQPQPPAWRRFGGGPGRMDERGPGRPDERGRGEFARPGRRGGDRGFGPGQRFGSMRGRGNFSSNPLEQMEGSLDMANFGSVVILNRSSNPVFLFPNRGGHDLLNTLLGRRSENAAKPDHLTAEQVASWDRLVADFQPTETFRDLALTQLESLEKAESEGEATTAANQLLSMISYPLTVFAMVVVVLGFGHLLSNRPNLEESVEDYDKRREVVIKSLAIIAMLSVVDLIWTLSASSAGAMRELNPLGSRMIADPATLTLFKIAVTGTSIGILYCLQRRPVAQLASWWCCLLLTLLTARWVVLQSLFV